MIVVRIYMYVVEEHSTEGENFESRKLEYS